jgi:hypothetical protein
MAVQAKFPAYADFAWSDIQTYLATKYPDWTEYNPQQARFTSVDIMEFANIDFRLQINDQWTFDLPEALNAVS